MKLVWVALPFVLFIACKKSGSKPVVSNERLDLSEVLYTDDYFKSNKTKVSKPSDSLQKSFVELQDVNADGVPDTAYITKNILNGKINIRFNFVNSRITESNANELFVKSVGDLNGDGIHEIMTLLQSEESCWDEVKLYSYKEQWVEKYDGLTYQCTDQNNYRFRKIGDKLVEFTTYGINKDSIDITNGDTLESIIPNAPNTHLIQW